MRCRVTRRFIWIQAVWHTDNIFTNLSNIEALYKLKQARNLEDGNLFGRLMVKFFLMLNIPLLLVIIFRILSSDIDLCCFLATVEIADTIMRHFHPGLSWIKNLELILIKPLKDSLYLARIQIWILAWYDFGLCFYGD